MNSGGQITTEPGAKGSWVCIFHEALFPFNIAFAIAYAFWAHAFGFLDVSLPLASQFAADYFILRAGIRINSFLGLKPDSRVGAEGAFAVSVICLAALMWLVLRSLRGTTLHSFLLRFAAGGAALFAVPLATLILAAERVDIRSAGITYVFAAEVFFFLVLLLLARYKPVSLWLSGFLWLLHCSWWGYFLWTLDHPIVLGYLVRSLLVPLLLSLEFPFSALVWLLYMKTSGHAAQHARASKGRRILILISSGVPIVLLLFLWAPSPSVPIGHAKDPKSLVVTLNRLGCMGSCPIYEIKLFGNGAVEYSGTRNVRVHGVQKTSISADQLARLVMDMDRVKFFSLQDEAFRRCFDTPRVSVSVSVDGRQKRVTSDNFCVGPGPQTRFVAMADEIDKVVNSDQWVPCKGHCGP